MTDRILNFSTGICNSYKKLLEANTIMPKSFVSLRKVSVFENLGLLKVICWSSKNATNSAWNWFRLYWGLDPNPWLAFGRGVEVGMDSEVSMICTEAYESFCGFKEAMGIFRKESIGMAIPITNNYRRWGGTAVCR